MRKESQADHRNGSEGQIAKIHQDFLEIPGVQHKVPIRVALNHTTSYRYERPVHLSPHQIRLRPAPHCRTPVTSYSLQVKPADHFVNWQQDPHSNFVARYVFPKPASELRVEVDLIAELTVQNPFDFFVEPYADQFPFRYEPAVAQELATFLEAEPAGPKLAEYLAGIDRTPQNTVDFLVALNQGLQERVDYLIRMEPGVQTPEETLSLGRGSCRDSSWLLVQVFRHLGLAARFVSGYLIQLKPDVVSLDGPCGAEEDFTDLHAWAEVFLPGAGWIGLDPTSGLFAGEGHLPLACTPAPSAAAPITGAVESCETEFEFSMEIERVREDPRVTLPYSDAQWERIQAVGRRVDEELIADDVRLTMGGEPTFVSIDDMDGAEWNTDAVGPAKLRLSETLLLKLREQFAPQGLLHFGQGKWYPGEPLPRWAMAVYWRRDGQPIWRNPRWYADQQSRRKMNHEDAERFLLTLAERLEVGTEWVRPVYEDMAYHLWKEHKLPVDIKPEDPKLKDPEERARMARVFGESLGHPVGYFLPIRRQWWQAQARWTSGAWPTRMSRICLLPGDSPVGLRLPLDSLPASGARYPMFAPADPTAPRPPLPLPPGRRAQPEIPAANFPMSDAASPSAASPSAASPSAASPSAASPQNLSDEVVRTALCAETRKGQLYVFMPPTEQLEDYLDLVAAIEDTAEHLELPVILEGYPPPHDHRLQHIKVTPDPGVLEVNVQPAESWDELVEITSSLYEEARLTRLGTEKFDLDGKHTGTGGGNHIVLGGPTPLDSPFLRRPDLLASLVAYWNNHPALSYLFSGTFVGPTSQAPRVDEGRRDSVYELEVAIGQLSRETACPPWLVDRLFRHLLVDLTGNTHRAEFCIDKLYSPDSSTGRLGLVEFRAFEMPPHARMSLTQQLLLRALVSRFWKQPYREPLIRWGTALHDRYLLPHFVREDLANVISETQQAGFEIEPEWFRTHFEFRFPRIGDIVHQDVQLELRQAIEPWYVLGEEPGGGGMTRFVDSSVERVQLRVHNLIAGRHEIVCRGVTVPLHPTGNQGEYVAGVRYRAWQPPSCLHPTIGVHTPLVFDILDRWNSRSIGGCTYHVAHPSGRNYETFPVNAYEAEARRSARFWDHGHTPGTIHTTQPRPTPEYTVTLDLRHT